MKILKWFGIVILSIFVSVELLIFISGKTYLNRVFINTIFSGKLGPDIDELNMFEKATLPIHQPQPWPVSQQYNQHNISLDLFAQIERYKTVSLVVIKNDSVLYEKHWEGYNDSSYVNSFSMAKSIVGMLIGCAIKDG
jgi:hypothetical protein